MPQYELKVIQNTILKQTPITSDQITDDLQKHALPAGTILRLHSYRYDAAKRHFKVAFLFDSFYGKNTWYVFADHVEILKDGVVLPEGQPNQVKLDIPWFSQLDNHYNPTGACNVTAIAMSLYYLGLRSKKPNEQLEDELYRFCETQGLSRHSAYDLAKLVKAYGFQDDFQDKADWDDVKTWLSQGNPIVAHGWFTREGHIVTLIGYNDRGWIVNDPNGEWFEHGYDTNASGAGLTYSYKMMERICGPTGDLFIHYIRK